MCGEYKFLICKRCGKLAGVIIDTPAPTMCCGEAMSELIPNTVEASAEKHLPVVKAEGDRVSVNVGSAAHPMDEAHHISWIYLLTQNGGQRKCLQAGGPPEAEFILTDSQAVAAFAYCNLHGLWKTDI